MVSCFKCEASKMQKALFVLYYCTYISGMDFRFEIRDSTSSSSASSSSELVPEWQFQAHSPEGDDPPWLEWYNTSLRKVQKIIKTLKWKLLKRN